LYQHINGLEEIFRSYNK